MALAASSPSVPTKPLRVAEVVTALSQALDLGSGASPWHSVRTCILGMRIAAEVRLSEKIRNELYYALILKDAGCSSNASEIFNALEALEPPRSTVAQGHHTRDRICQAFAQIVDPKSPFTFNHSNGVANAAVAIAKQLDFSDDRILFVRHTALLHNLGKMAVSNAILEKPGKLDENEWKAMRSHPEFTLAILRSIKGFEHMAEIAASHHEKLDGSGYFRGLRAGQMSLEARILVVADIFDALSADRPYRAAMPREKIFTILHKDSPRALDSDRVEALDRSRVSCDQTFRDIYSLQTQLEQWGSRSRAADRPPGGIQAPSTISTNTPAWIS